jgi:di/tricarboxylate transporter
MLPELPSPHAGFALLLTLGAFVAFATARLRIELICLILIAVMALGFYLFPLVPPGRLSGLEIAFGGFSHEALIAICCLMILGRGLVVTGALDPAARALGRLWNYNRSLGMLFSLVVSMAISMFVNDTPVLVLTLPILLTLATRAGVPATQTLMPVNCAILIGGMSTTIGTSTNLLVVSLAADLGVPPIGVFSFTSTVLVAAAIALPYLWLVMPRLLPSLTPDQQVRDRVYRAVLHAVRADTFGGSLRDVVQRIGIGAQVVGAVRGGRSLRYADDPGLRLEPTDHVEIEGTPEQLRDASEALKAPLGPPEIAALMRSIATAERADEQIVEIVLGVDSGLVGRSVTDAAVSDRYGVAVLGIARAEALPFRHRPEPHEEALAVGDVLLLRGTPARLAKFERGEGTLTLQGGMELPSSNKAPLALLIVAAVVALAATRTMPVALAALAGTIAMLATGTLRYDRIGRALSLEVIVLVAASIALGRALVATGAADWLGSVFAQAVSSFSPFVALAALMTFATVLTNFISNAAAAAITTPIAVSFARSLGLEAEPFVLAVLFGCNLCYVTPMAYQTNLLIMSAAGYRFGDFVRAGLPLALIMITSLAWLLARQYGL